MKTVLFHANCPDGAAAAWAAWKVLGEAKYIPVNYGQPIPEIPDGSEVYVLDFSYPAADLIELHARMERLVVLDHHASAQADLAAIHFTLPSLIYFDMARSGAVLAWEYFHPDEPVPEILEYVQDRDLWEWKLPKSREVSAALQMRGWTNETFDKIHLVPLEIDKLKQEGELILKFKNAQVEIMAKNHRFAYLNTAKRMIRFTEKLEPGGDGEPMVGPEIHIMPVANATVFFSEVGEKLLEMFPAFQCAAYYFDRKEGQRQWGLRSREGFDCSLICKAFGGGGHKAAAGFVEAL